MIVVMPQHYQPSTLYKLSLDSSVTFINILCKNVEDRYGNYDSASCRKHVSIVQNYLVSKLPRLILDAIFNAVEDVETINDPRVLLSLYMHKHIQNLDNPINVINKRLSIKPHTDFWIQELPRLSELVHLNLKLNCTDSILKVVGTYCKKLEYINIVSKTESERLKTGNALKIRYLVSDEGLQYLTNCTLLKEIEMNPILRSNFGGKLTMSGIRVLVESLKCLHKISFNYMGEVLATIRENSEILSLLSITDYDAQPGHMAAISRLCPNVRSLTLICSRHSSHEEVGSRTVAILSDSSLQLRHLHLEKFNFNLGMRNLFQVKGQFVKNLVLKCPGRIVIDDIVLIGSTCPNITSFHLDEFELVSTAYSKVPSSNSYFRNLESLVIVGKEWAEETILNICLSKASGIQVLCLYNSRNLLREGELDSIDVLLTNILKKNPMNNLITLYLCTGRPISMQMVNYFYNNCSELQTFIMNHKGLSDDEEFLKLGKKISENNINLVLRCIF